MYVSALVLVLESPAAWLMRCRPHGASVLQHATVNHPQQAHLATNTYCVTAALMLKMPSSVMYSTSGLARNAFSASVSSVPTNKMRVNIHDEVRREGRPTCEAVEHAGRPLGVGDSRGVAVVGGEPLEVRVLRNAVPELDDVRARLRRACELLHRVEGRGRRGEDRRGEEREGGGDGGKELHGGVRRAG